MNRACNIFETEAVYGCRPRWMASHHAYPQTLSIAPAHDSPPFAPLLREEQTSRPVEM